MVLDPITGGYQRTILILVLEILVNGMRIRQSLPQPYIAQTGMSVPWKVQWLGAGVQGLWSNHRARATVDCREMD